VPAGLVPLRRDRAGVSRLIRSVPCSMRFTGRPRPIPGEGSTRCSTMLNSRSGQGGCVLAGRPAVPPAPGLAAQHGEQAPTGTLRRDLEQFRMGMDVELPGHLLRITAGQPQQAQPIRSYGSKISMINLPDLVTDPSGPMGELTHLKPIHPRRAGRRDGF
jgi:hypothetical protein